MKEEKKNSKFIGIVVLAIFLGILLGIGIVVLKNKEAMQEQTADLQEKEESQEIRDNMAKEDMSIPNRDQLVEKWQEGVISYNGVSYQYNHGLQTYLYLGIDKEGKVQKASDAVSGGQSDALLLLVIDPEKEKMSVIAIHRNTMTDVDVYDKDGTFKGTYRLQICLQHGYGDGMKISASRSVEAVKNLFYQVQIDGYLAMNMGAVPILNDALGGITIYPKENMTIAKTNKLITADTPVKLTGEEAYEYVRSRDVEEFDSATNRLERQIVYLKGLDQTLSELGTQKENTLMKVYEQIQDYVVSNIELAEFVEKISACDPQKTQFYTLEGTTTMGETYEEYNVDEKALYELILEVFYKKVPESVSE